MELHASNDGRRSRAWRAIRTFDCASGAALLVLRADDTPLVHNGIIYQYRSRVASEMK